MLSPESGVMTGALVDYDQDGWPDIFVANDTQPNKLYRNLRNGMFRDVALEAGVALSQDGKARAGMGVDAADFDGSGKPGLAVTNFVNEMIGVTEFMISCVSTLMSFCEKSISRCSSSSRMFWNEISL